MPIKLTDAKLRHEAGASLIEVLVAILILSFGMLSLGGMLTFAVQLPKLAAYRASATNLASNFVERVRANPEGFSANNYTASLNETSAWSYTPIAVSGSNCSFTGTQCSSSTLATADINEIRSAVRRELPAGDMMMKCNPTPCTQTSVGEVWIAWQEPSTFAALGASSDQCSSEATTAYSSPAPRCLYIRFKIE